jgi:large subunit ribosomal protein L15
MFTLNTLKKITKDRKRIGKGGKYRKNAGKGHKGQNKRAGKTRLGFEGGQTSILRRTPKLKGENFNPRKRQQEVLSLTVISNNFADNEEITLASLKEKGIINRFTNHVRVFNSGKLTIVPNFSSEIYLTKGVKTVLNK